MADPGSGIFWLGIRDGKNSDPGSRIRNSLEETPLHSFLNIFAPFLLRQTPPANTGRNITSHTERCKPKRRKEEYFYSTGRLLTERGGGDGA